MIWFRLNHVITDMINKTKIESQHPVLCKESSEKKIGSFPSFTSGETFTLEFRLMVNFLTSDELFSMVDAEPTFLRA